MFHVQNLWKNAYHKFPEPAAVSWNHYLVWPRVENEKRHKLEVYSVANDRNLTRHPSRSRLVASHRVAWRSRVCVSTCWLCLALFWFVRFHHKFGLGAVLLGIYLELFWRFLGPVQIWSHYSKILFFAGHTWEIFRKGGLVLERLREKNLSLYWFSANQATSTFIYYSSKELQVSTFRFKLGEAVKELLVLQYVRSTGVRLSTLQQKHAALSNETLLAG